MENVLIEADWEQIVMEVLLVVGSVTENGFITSNSHEKLHSFLETRYPELVFGYGSWGEWANEIGRSNQQSNERQYYHVHWGILNALQNLTTVVN